jgi:hypothetical protein
VLQALKRDPALAGILVVMLTIVDEKNRSYALGAADYLTNRSSATSCGRCWPATAAASRASTTQAAASARSLQVLDCYQAVKKRYAVSSRTRQVRRPVL